MPGQYDFRKPTKQVIRIPCQEKRPIRNLPPARKLKQPKCTTEEETNATTPEPQVYEATSTSTSLDAAMKERAKLVRRSPCIHVHVEHVCLYARDTELNSDIGSRNYSAIAIHLS